MDRSRRGEAPADVVMLLANHISTPGAYYKDFTRNRLHAVDLREHTVL